MALAARSPHVAADVFTLQSHEIGAHWHWIEPLLFLVKDAGWNVDDVRSELLAERAQLWAIHDGREATGIVITRLGGLGGTSYGVIWIAAGEPLHAGLSVLREHIEPWFISKGCQYVEIYGRAGWGRVLPDYEERARVFVKELLR